MSTDFKPDFHFYPPPIDVPRFKPAMFISEALADPVPPAIDPDARSCDSDSSSCSGAAADRCVPHFNPRSPAWGGAFARTIFSGDANPIGWLSAHPWAQPRLALAVRMVAREIAKWGVDPVFVFSCDWDYESPTPEVFLSAFAPAFAPREYGTPEYEAVKVCVDELVEAVDHWVRPLEHPTFDGRETRCGERVRFAVDLMGGVDALMNPEVRDLLQGWIAERNFAEGPLVLRAE